MLRVYEGALAATVPQFPREMESRIDAYLAASVGPETTGPLAEHRPVPMSRGRTID
jgi:hypothetical protein